jgi:hypothetical protein
VPRALQLALLQSLNYVGPQPTSRADASSLIQQTTRQRYAIKPGQLKVLRDMGLTEHQIKRIDSRKASALIKAFFTKRHGCGGKGFPRRPHRGPGGGSGGSAASAGFAVPGSLPTGCST